MIVTGGLVGQKDPQKKDEGKEQTRKTTKKMQGEFLVMKELVTKSLNRVCQRFHPF